MIGYTHVPCTLDGVDPVADKIAMFNGDCIARIMREDKGPMSGRWRWYLQWLTVQNTGDEASLEEALAFVKLAHLSAGQPASVTSHAPKARLNLTWNTPIPSQKS